MAFALATRAKDAKAVSRTAMARPNSAAGGFLQRKCACGNHMIAGSECEECSKTKSFALQTRLKVNEPGDIYEQEADLIADRVMTTPVPGAARAVPPRIQRFSGRSNTQIDAVPGSVDQALAAPGRPLEPVLRQEMEQRFGYDFSAVRVHTGRIAELSAQDVNAHAYTVGHDIVFSAGRFSPETTEGRRLLAHELTHAAQQGAAPTADAQAPGSRIFARAEGTIQRDIKPKPHQPSARLVQLAEKAIDELDDDQRSKVLLTTVLSAGKLGELPAFTAILKAKPHEDFGDYFIFLINELEESRGSRNIVGILQLFADAGVDITEQLKTSYSLQPLAAVAKFKSLVQRYDALVRAGKVPEADRQRLRQSIDEAEMAIRGIEGPARKPGTKVGLMGGAAVVAWKAAAFLAADDATVIGVADDVLIPFVVVGAAILSGIAIFTSGHKPEMLDYRPAKEKVDAALVLLALLLAQAQRPAPQPKPQRTTDVAPVPQPEPEPDPERRRRRCSYPTGLTAADPIPINWYKPKVDDWYPPRIELQGRSYNRDEESKMPDGRTPIGVPDPRWPRIGKIVQLAPDCGVPRSSSTCPNSDRFREALRGYGFNWSGLQADHVQDVQWADPGGDHLDVFNNLWPMDKSANLSAGSLQNLHQPVTFCETLQGPQVGPLPIRDITRLGRAGRRFYGRYFRIANIARGPT